MKEKMVIGIAKWAKKSEDMLVRVQKLAADLDLDKEDLEKIGEHGEKPISLVFVGQYSAGKSTIIKALTGLESIAIGAGITTQEAQIYNWNGLQVIDTPGIHTVLRPEHDAISYKAIAEADILVYVVTQELFNNEIGHDFRHLLIDQDKKKEMILVVNKMADIGNTPENQEIKRKDLEKVTEPYTPEEIHTVFIDAESYLDSLFETDSEIAKELWTRSNFQQLIEALNVVVKEQGSFAKLTTMLYTLIAYLQKNIEKYSLESKTANFTDERKILEQNLQDYQSIRRKMDIDITENINDASAEIRDIGIRLAKDIDNWESGDNGRAAIQNAVEKVDVISRKCKAAIEKEAMEGELKDFKLNEKLAELTHSFKVESNTIDSLSKRMLENGMLEKGFDFANKIDIKPIILKIGHYFDYKFKPWQAKKFSKGTKFALEGAETIIDISNQLKKERDAVQKEQEKKSNQDMLCAAFYDASCALSEHFKKERDEILKMYDDKIGNIKQRFEEMEFQKTQISEAHQAILQAEQDCQSLIKEIHDEF